MDPFTFALGAFSLLAGGIISFAKHKYDSDPTTPGTAAYYNSNSLELAKSNLALNEKVAQQNFDLSKEQFNYQKELNALQMQREDTAFQRQVADLKAAGLSPLNISGNGASASPLTSANAPQFDVSGINQAVSNSIGAWNDAFTRKLQSSQFRLQNKVQTAQMYTNLAESYLQQKKLRLENQYMSEELNYNRLHGFRDLNWKSELTLVLENLLKSLGNRSSALPEFKPSFNFSLPSPFGKKSDESDLGLFAYKPPVTQNQIDKDIKILNDSSDDDYDRFTKIIMKGNELSGDSFESAAKYLWRHADVPKSFDSFDEFLDTLRNNSDYRKNIRNYVKKHVTRSPW